MRSGASFRYGVYTPGAEQVGEKAVGEKRFYGRFADIKSARIGAERRHDHAKPVGNEASPAQAAATPRDGGTRVEVAGDFSRA